MNHIKCPVCNNVLVIYHRNVHLHCAAHYFIHYSENLITLETIYFEKLCISYSSYRADDGYSILLFKSIDPSYYKYDVIGKIPSSLRLNSDLFFKQIEKYKKLIPFL